MEALVKKHHHLQKSLQGLQAENVLLLSLFPNHKLTVEDLCLTNARRGIL